MAARKPAKKKAKKRQTASPRSNNAAASSQPDSLSSQGVSQAFEYFFENNPDYCYMVSASGNIIAVNKAARAFLGKKSSGLIGRPVLTTVYPKKSQPRAKELFAQWKKAGRLRNEEIAIVSKSRKEHTVLLSVDAVKNKKGRVISSISVQRDITGRKKEQEELKSANQQLKAGEQQLRAANQQLRASSQTLRASEERYRNFVENFQGIAFISGMDWVPILFHGAVKKITGYTEKNFLAGKPSWYDIVHPDDRDMLWSTGAKLHTEPGFQVERDYRIITKSGKIRWVQDIISNVCDRKGKIVRLQGAVYDITERKRMERLSAVQRDLGLALSSADALENGLRLCLDAAVAASGMDCGGVYIVDEETGELSLIVHRGLSSEFISEASHYGRESPNTTIVMSGKPTYAGYSQLGVQMDDIQQREALRAIAVIPVMHEGKVIACLNISSHAHDEIPQTARTILETIAAQIGSAVARLRIQKALHESEEQFRQLAEQSPNMIFINRFDRVVYANRRCEELLGFEREHFYSEHFDLMSIIAPRSRAKIMENFARHKHGDDIEPYEYSLVKKDGTEIEAIISTKLINYAGTPAILGIVTDITDRKKAEEELQKAQRLELLGILAGGIAHDFNNLLGGLFGYVDMARVYCNIDEQAKHYLNQAMAAFRRARSLTQQLLTFSKGGEPVTNVVSLAPLIREAGGLATSGSKTRCTYRIPDDLWAAEIDEGQIGQVINNVVINARQAMASGGTVEISAINRVIEKENRKPLADGDYVEIAVADHGTGIPQEHVQKIFAPFFTTKQKGAGLGLAISYSIVKKHGGHIDVQSQPGRGTTFRIYLPASKKGVPAHEEAAAKQPGSGRVLIMDDEHLVLEMACSMLTGLGYKTEGVADGTQALDAYARAKEQGAPFDIVILDLTIPAGMGGYETMQKLLELDPQVKGIVSSGYADDPMLAEYAKHGFCGAVTKPYRIKDVSQTLAFVLSGKK
jgi:PAS domain S-box-containing protein